jgi:hypothetical protein
MLVYRLLLLQQDLRLLEEIFGNQPWVGVLVGQVRMLLFDFGFGEFVMKAYSMLLGRAYLERYL